MNTAVSLMVAFCVSVLTATALAFPLHGLGRGIATASLCAGAVAGAVQFAAGLRRRRENPQRAKTSPWEWPVIAVYILFSIRAFCWLVFWKDGKLEVLSPNNLGDISLHLTYINNFALGVPFWPENPIFAGDGVHYPIGVDVFNSLLKLVGVDVYIGLVWVGLASCAVTAAALYKWGRGFALAGFLFNGGLAGFQFLTTGFHFQDYQADLAWKSIPLAMFVTQRGLLYAVPAGLALLSSWRIRFFPGEEGKNERPLPFLTELLLYSTLPLFHLHTFIFLSFLLGCWIVAAAVRWFSGVEFLPAIPLAAPVRLVILSIIPATLLVSFLTGGFKNGSIIHFVGPSSSSQSWDWEYGEQPQFAAWAQRQQPHLGFLTDALGHVANWVVNYGAMPFFIVTLFYAIFMRRRDASYVRAGAFVLPATLMFFIACFVMFAKWDWDNTKIFLWCYLAVLPFLWDELIAKEKLPLRALCCFMLYFSGFVSLFGGIDGTHDGYELFTELVQGEPYVTTRADLDGTASAVRGLPPTAVFAGFATYNHPLLLEGRKMVEGYAGHLDSNGIDYEKNLTLLASLLNGEPGWHETARKLHARYLFWGKLEEGGYPDSAKPWEDECLEVAEGDFGKIYDLETPAAPKADAPQPQ